MYELKHCQSQWHYEGTFTAMKQNAFTSEPRSSLNIETHFK